MKNNIVLLMTLFFLGISNPIFAQWCTFNQIQTAGELGQQTKLLVVNGNPAMAYYHKTSEFNTRFVRATDVNGTNWGSPIVVHDDWRAGDTSMDMEIVNGNPAIIVFLPVDKTIKYRRAMDVNGTSWDTVVEVLTSTGNTSGGDIYLDLEIVNGNPATCYWKEDTDDLMFLRANDANGTSWAAPIAVETTGNVGQHASLTIINGQPAISYTDLANKELKYVQATDASGSTWGTPVTVDMTTDVAIGEFSSLEEINGRPAIAYSHIVSNSGDNSNRRMRYIRANDVNGTNWGSPQTINNEGTATEINLSILDGKPVVACRNNNTKTLVFLRANDADGASWQNAENFSISGPQGDVSFAVVNGKASIGYGTGTGVTPNQDLNYIQYETPMITCSINNPSAVAEQNTNTLTYQFTRTGGCLTEPLTIRFSLAGTVDDDDFVVTEMGTGEVTYDENNQTGTITFPANISMINLEIKPKANNIVEANETIGIKIEP